MNLTKSLTGIAPLVLFLMSGCSNPADDVPEADVQASSTNASAAVDSSTTAASGAESYFAFGPDDSNVSFTGSKVTGSHSGGFKKFVGELKVVDGALAGAGNKVVIDMSSLWADSDKLAGHLRSPDFFDAANIPTSTFETTAIAKTGTNSLVTGNLTLHGVTKQISFPANIQVEQSAINVNAQFFINRFDFDIRYPGRANDLIRKEVVLKLDVKATPGRAKFAEAQ
jgi:polyisoprenoid-binding protein YceI